MMKPPEILQPWLVHQQFLTEKLHAITNDTCLNVLDQRWEAPDAWDLSILKLQATQVIHRQILMSAYDIPCWYARTIIPDTTWQANTGLFDRLKTESLGHLIFYGTEIRRASLTHYMISPSSIEYSWLNKSWHQGESALWVRLSEFVVNSQNSFFLVEVLLPGLLRYPS